MCGIYSCFNNRHTVYDNKGAAEEKDYILCDQHDCLRARGPDEVVVVNTEDSQLMAFYRLAIVGVEQGHQPFNILGVRLMCNGEIYNHKELMETYGIKCTTGSDCEIIVHLYRMFGIEETVRLLDGEFAFVLYDTHDGLVHFTRDYMGIKPLYIASVEDGEVDEVGLKVEEKVLMIELASSIKAMNLGYKAVHVLPRHIYTYDLAAKVLSSQVYETLQYRNLYKFDNGAIYDNFVRAVEKRITQSERPVGFFLSGGLDSSLVLSIALEYYDRQRQVTCVDSGDDGDKDGDKDGDNKLQSKPQSNLQSNLQSNSQSNLQSNSQSNLQSNSQSKPQVFTFGFSENAPDVKSAKIMVEFLRGKYGKDCMDWHLVIQDVSEGIKAIPHVVEALETYDTTTIRASTPMYLLSKYIAEKTEVKVVLSGEGSDELFGGYLYFKYAPNDIAFRCEILKLMNNLYLYDVLRADRMTAAHGLEIRPPFLDKTFVNSVLSSVDLKRSAYTTKELLRKCVSNKNLLPDEILWGKKEAFSDAVGLSWKDTIAKYSIDALSEPHGDIFEYSRCIYPCTAEMKYFQMLFHSLCKGAYHLLPALWLPNQTWVKTGVEPSARVLPDYNEKNKIVGEDGKSINSGINTADVLFDISDIVQPIDRVSPALDSVELV
jgi:asparagine synthase (glutamine-hydrolysing)